MATLEEVKALAAKADKPGAKANTDLTPVATNPQTGYNTYELRDPAGQTRKLELWAASSFVEKSKGRIQTDPSVITNIERRMKVLFDRYAGRDLDPTFAMDMVASDLSDDEMVRLYDQRFAFFDRAEDKRGFWSKAWHVMTFQGAAEQVDRALPGDSFTDTLAHPIKSLNNSIEFVNRNTVDKFAQVVTGDQSMTFNTLFATGIMASKALLPGITMEEVRDEYGYDQATHTFKDPETGEALDAQAWMATKAPGWVQAANFAGEFVDPFMFMFMAKTARAGARIVRQPGALARPTQGALTAMKDTKGVWGKFKSFNEARHSKSIESFASRRFGWFGTTVDDLERLTKGDLKWVDYLKGVNLREIAGSKLFPSRAATPAWVREMGFYPKHVRYFEEAAMARSAEHIRTLKPNAPGWWVQHQADIAEEGRRLGKGTADIAEDIRQEWIKLYDPAEIARWDELSTAAQKRHALAKEELDAMEESFIDPLDDPHGPFPLTQEERLARQPEGRQAAFSEATRREFQYRQEMIAVKQSQGSIFQVTDTIPRHAWSPAFRQWLDHATITNIGELGTPGAIMDRAAVKGARTLKHVMAYTPHRAVEITDDFSHIEFRKLLQNTELDVVGWSAADTSAYYTKYLRAADDSQRFALMNELSNDVFARMGFNPAQIERIKIEYGQWWGKATDTISTMDPKRITLMDPHLIRRLSKLGPKALEPAALKDLMEKTLRTWKKLAITRPAWFFRVVILSEQPRAAMAGMPNLLTHPLINLATSQVPGVSRAARGVLGARLAVPGWKSRLTLNYEMMDNLLAGSDLGVALGRTEKRAIKARLERSLGTLSVSGQPSTTQLMHWEDMKVSGGGTDADRIGYMRGWAEILNDRLPADDLHRLFLEGKTAREGQQWAHSEAASAWRNKNNLEAGSTELNRRVVKERKYFDDLTRKDQEIIDHLRTGNKFHWKDLMDVDPPRALPVDVFTGRLDRPGLSLRREQTKRIMQNVFDSMSSTPSFWFSRFPGYRLGYANDTARYVGIYGAKERKLANAVEITPEVLAGARESKAARDALETSRQAMTAEESALHAEYISQRMAPLGPGIRDKLVDELAHNANQRGAVRAFLDDMTPSEDLVVFRGHAKGKLWEGEAGNASLDYRQAQKFAGPDGAVTEVHIRKDDIIAIGAAGEDEVLFRVRDAIIPGAKGAGLANTTESLKRIVAYGQGKPVTLTALEKRIADWSHQGASFKVRQTFYDLNESSRVADMGRFIAPFGNAWQEEITRWALLAYQRPAMPYAIMTAWRNKEDLPFSYTDPRSGDEMFAIPWSQNIVNAATGRFNPLTGAPTGISLPLTGRWKNLNIITGSGVMPGGGPFLTIPAKALSHAPGGLGHIFQGIHAVIDPYGSTELSLGDVFPSPFYRAAQKLEDDPAHDAALAQAVVAHHFNRTGGNITPELEVLMEDQLRALKAVNFGAQILVGSGIKANLAPKLREMVDYLKWAQHNFGNFAQGIFLERYGDDAAAYMVNLTQSMTGAPPTKEAEEMLLDPANRVWGKSKAFWALRAESARGEWDPIASAAQIRRNDREARDIHGMVGTAYTIAGWYRYGILKDEFAAALARAGLTTRSQGPTADAMKGVFQGKVQKLFAAYPGFQKELEDVDFNAWKQNMRDLYKLSNDKIAAGLQGTAGAKAFFEEVRKVVPALRAADFKSLSTKGAEPYAQVFARHLDGIFRKYPDFRLVYNRLGLDSFDGRDSDLPAGLLEE